MPNLQIIINNKIATYVKRSGAVVCGNSDYVAEFAFDQEWGAYENKIARFTWGGKYFDVPFTGSTCQVPIVRDTHTLTVGVYAGNLCTTTPASIPCQRSILCNTGLPLDEDEPAYISAALEAAEEAKAAAEEAKQAAESVEGAGDAVLFVPQDLTEEQKAQARENIGVAEALQASGDTFTFVNLVDNSDASNFTGTNGGKLTQEDGWYKLTPDGSNQYPRINCTISQPLQAGHKYLVAYTMKYNLGSIVANSAFPRLVSGGTTLTGNFDLKSLTGERHYAANRCTCVLECETSAQYKLEMMIGYANKADAAGTWYAVKDINLIDLTDEENVENGDDETEGDRTDNTVEIPAFVGGGIKIVDNNLSYTTADSNRVRTPDNTFIYLNEGDTLGLPDYSLYFYRVYYQVEGTWTEQTYHGVKGDFVAPIAGDYAVAIQSTDASYINDKGAEISSLLFITRANPDEPDEPEEPEVDTDKREIPEPYHLGNMILAQSGGLVTGTTVVDMNDEALFPLQNHTILFMGDSIFGNYNIPKYVRDISKANVVNGAIGGTTASYYNASQNLSESLVALSEAIKTGDWTAQAASTKEAVARLRALDFKTVTDLVIEIGTNDWRRCAAIGEDGSTDIATFKGALNTIIGNILSTYPEIDIYMLTPLFRTEFGNSNTTPNDNGVYLYDFADAMIDVARKHGIPVYDMYHHGGVNEYNHAKYLSDGTHPTPIMRMKIAKIINDMIVY